MQLSFDHPLSSAQRILNPLVDKLVVKPFITAFPKRRRHRLSPRRSLWRPCLTAVPFAAQPDQPLSGSKRILNPLNDGLVVNTACPTRYTRRRHRLSSSGCLWGSCLAAVPFPAQPGSAASAQQARA